MAYRPKNRKMQFLMSAFHNNIAKVSLKYPLWKCHLCPVSQEAAHLYLVQRPTVLWWELCASHYCITRSHFSLPPGSIQNDVDWLSGNVWAMMYTHMPHSFTHELQKGPGTWPRASTSKLELPVKNVVLEAYHTLSLPCVYAYSAHT